MHLLTTRHAAERWRERIEDVHLGLAFRKLEDAADVGILIPRRLAWKFHPVLGQHKMKRRADFYVTPKAMIVVYQNKMVTVLPFSFEAYVCILVWKAFGCLPLEYPEWGRLTDKD